MDKRTATPYKILQNPRSRKIILKRLQRHSERLLPDGAVEEQALSLINEWR
jgi:hypothetical protein